MVHNTEHWAFNDNDFIESSSLVKWIFCSQAQAVIVALSPGYLEYAEEFRHGAKSSASKQQEIIRWLHEKIKDEHIAQHRKPKSEMNSRFLPLLLKKMNAVEKHMPDIFKTMKWKKFANKNDKWLESLKKKLANKFLKERETWAVGHVCRVHL